mgnify:CR=1 FL=1
MSNKKPVVVYGASGYTGRLIAESLRNYDIPFIAAGRNAERVAEAMKLVPGIETADYEIVEVEHTVEALAELFKGTKVICNTVGPFHYFGETVVEAAAIANVHYLDTTGEIFFMNKVKNKFSDNFKANGKVLAPCTSYMYVPLEIAARVALETPGIDSLEAVCYAAGTPTYGSTQSIFSMFQAADDAFFIQNNERVIWPKAKGYEVMVPGETMTQLTHCWGGGSLPLFFESDARVRNCRQLTGFTNRELMEQVIAMQNMYENDIKPLSAEEQSVQLKAIGESIQPGMPPRENPLVHRCVDFVKGRGGNNTSGCTVRSFTPYLLTGVVQAATANFLLNGHQLESGFVSACQAVGYQELMGQLQNFGLIEVEID